MSKEQPAYFYGSMPIGERPKVIKKVMPNTYDIHSKVVQVMGADYEMHDLVGLRYDHDVSLYFNFKSRKTMEKAHGNLGDYFKYRSRMFLVYERIEGHMHDARPWLLIVRGKCQDKPLYPRP